MYCLCIDAGGISDQAKCCHAAVPVGGSFYACHFGWIGLYPVGCLYIFCGCEIFIFRVFNIMDVYDGAFLSDHKSAGGNADFYRVQSYLCGHCICERVRNVRQGAGAYDVDQIDRMEYRESCSGDKCF